MGVDQSSSTFAPRKLGISPLSRGKCAQILRYYVITTAGIGFAALGYWEWGFDDKEGCRATVECNVPDFSQTKSTLPVP
jgi:hypothetical protein